MDRIQLGRSPVWVSEQIFGAMAIGPARHDEQRRIETIHAAIDAGITTIDTAPLYDLGMCEQQVGRAIRGLRDRVQVMTKIGLRWDDPRGEVLFRFKDEHGQRRAVRLNSRPDSLRVEIDRSLQRLGVDVIDCVHMHMLDPDTPLDDSMGTLASFVQQGKVRAVGVSTNFGPAQVRQAQRALGDVPLASLQLTYSPIERGFESELMPLARARRIAVLAHSSLERGLLTGKLAHVKLDAADLRRAEPKCHPANVARVTELLQRVIEPIASRHQASLAQVVLAWVRAQPTVSALVVGASWPEQARANARAMELALDATEVAQIRAAFEALELDLHAGVSLREQLRGPARRAFRKLRDARPSTLLALAERVRRRVFPARGARALPLAR